MNGARQETLSPAKLNYSPGVHDGDLIGQVTNK
jgi:hypothetical protein